MKHKLAIGLPVLNKHDLAEQAIQSFTRHAEKYVPFFVFDNGSDTIFNSGDYNLRSETNQGLPKAMNAILDLNEQEKIAEYIVFTHTDVIMYEENWDELVERHLSEDVGVLGFFGALGIGTADIYRTPYVMQQLARQAPIAGNKCKLSPNIHGHRQFYEDARQVAVLDGFCLIVKHDMRFWNDSIHHMYDNDICLQSWQMNRKVLCLNCNVDHLGGQTDVSQDWTKGTGKTKQEIHAESHVPFYEKYRNMLPFWVQ